MFAQSSPLKWPDPPERFSFTALETIAGCPRRWAYSEATFTPGGLADVQGRLVRRASWAAIRGVAVHATLEELLRIHRKENGPRKSDWSLVQFWVKHLPPGGLATLILNRGSKAIGEATEHSRNRKMRAPLLRQLAEETPSLVASVNLKLAKALPTQDRGPPSTQGVGRSLRAGASSEVWLEGAFSDGGKTYRVCGCVDVLTVSEEEVELLDYKTGAPHPEHHAQLELYALLLGKDERFNPDRRQATALALVYENGTVDKWPAPSEADLIRLGSALVQRCKAAVDLTALKPPPARVGEHCGWCDARQICSDYWAEPLRAAGTQLRRRVDFQGVIAGGSGDKSDVAMKVDEANVRLLVSPAGREEWGNARIGNLVRVTGARRVTVPQDEFEEDRPSGDVYELDVFSEVALVGSGAGAGH